MRLNRLLTRASPAVNGTVLVSGALTPRHGANDPSKGGGSLFSLAISPGCFLRPSASSACSSAVSSSRHSTTPALPPCPPSPTGPLSPFSSPLSPLSIPSPKFDSPFDSSPVAPVPAAPPPPFLLEELLIGPEVDVELVLFRGHVRYAAVSDNVRRRVAAAPCARSRRRAVCCIAHRDFTPLLRVLSTPLSSQPDFPPPFFLSPQWDTAPGSFFVDTGLSTPSSLPSSDQAALARAASDAVAALGFASGVFHVELRLTRARGPVLLEVNARMGGSAFAIAQQFGKREIE